MSGVTRLPDYRRFLALGPCLFVTFGIYESVLKFV